MIPFLAGSKSQARIPSAYSCNNFPSEEQLTSAFM